MANEEHLARLQQGVEDWNQWQDEHPEIRPDLSGADLSGADLSGAILSGADLSRANLEEANLSGADLTGAHLYEANLTRAYLYRTYLGQAHLVEAQLVGAHLDEVYLGGADLSGADLTEAQLREAELSSANLTEAQLRKANLEQANLVQANLTRAKLPGAVLHRADLTDANFFGAHLVGANLVGALLIETNFKGANLTGCHIYGISVWGVKLNDATEQRDLIISQTDEPTITVDDLEVAQFIYLLLNNHKVRNVINTIAEKAVLILGRFIPERKAVLEAMREVLRQRGCLPLVFDFERPTDRDFTETIMTLAGMCLFIIADITNPKSSPLELQATVPNYMIPFVPIIQEGEQPFAMFKDLKGKFNWVLDPLAYASASQLVRGLEKAVIRPALKKHAELLIKKTEELRIRHIEDYPDDEEDETNTK
jgi:uncharacterized protein YjbI with pentapeptide repeats